MMQLELIIANKAKLDKVFAHDDSELRGLRILQTVKDFLVSANVDDLRGKMSQFAWSMDWNDEGKIQELKSNLVTSNIHKILVDQK